MDEERFIEERPDIQSFSYADVVADISADVQDTDDIVDTSFIYRQAAVILLLDELQDLLLGHIDVNGRDVHAGRQNTLHGHIAELQRRGDQLALFLVDRTFLGHVLYDVIDIIFRDGRLVVAL